MTPSAVGTGALSTSGLASALPATSSTSAEASENSMSAQAISTSTPHYRINTFSATNALDPGQSILDLALPLNTQLKKRDAWGLALPTKAHSSNDSSLNLPLIFDVVSGSLPTSDPALLLTSFRVARLSQTSEHDTESLPDFAQLLDALHKADCLHSIQDRLITICWNKISWLAKNEKLRLADGYAFFDVLNLPNATSALLRSGTPDQLTDFFVLMGGYFVEKVWKQQFEFIRDELCDTELLYTRHETNQLERIVIANWKAYHRLEKSEFLQTFFQIVGPYALETLQQNSDTTLLNTLKQISQRLQGEKRIDNHLYVSIQTYEHPTEPGYVFLKTQQEHRDKCARNWLEEFQNGMKEKEKPSSKASQDFDSHDAMCHLLERGSEAEFEDFFFLIEKEQTKEKWIEHFEFIRDQVSAKPLSGQGNSSRLELVVTAMWNSYDTLQNDEFLGAFFKIIGPKAIKTLERHPDPILLYTLKEIAKILRDKDLIENDLYRSTLFYQLPGNPFPHRSEIPEEYLVLSATHRKLTPILSKDPMELEDDDWFEANRLHSELTTPILLNRMSANTLSPANMPKLTTLIRRIRALNQLEELSNHDMHSIKAILVLKNLRKVVLTNADAEGVQAYFTLMAKYLNEEAWTKTFQIIRDDTIIEDSLPRILKNTLTAALELRNPRFLNVFFREVGQKALASLSPDSRNNLEPVIEEISKMTEQSDRFVHQLCLSTCHVWKSQRSGSPDSQKRALPHLINSLPPEDVTDELVLQYKKQIQALNYLNVLEPIDRELVSDILKLDQATKLFLKRTNHMGAYHYLSLVEKYLDPKKWNQRLEFIRDEVSEWIPRKTHGDCSVLHSILQGMTLVHTALLGRFMLIFDAHITDSLNAYPNSRIVSLYTQMMDELKEPMKPSEEKNT